ncbi:fumarylacetoacetate hydrolase family protein [Ruegeria sp. 2012CJ41-6]|uniref:Fumarylacetoacetate hydrolase family protein n=1 Tax=Ruegeria spongiae TaxID=2942209 RepID=A0ABT0PYP7_9RHOB|nr:fumarylacetoacetate hydrolase family protein [Ruegeria spongiae]MCL6282705.1 fumarylacetoacetate hydrolase family protein [Ruegeria spongiae]
MTRHAFPIAERSTIPVVDSDTVFPVNRVFCVGRNYAAHAREMGADPMREPPFFFAKPADAILTGADLQLPYPPKTNDLHHEVEMVVGLRSGGLDIPVEEALGHVFGAALGIEFTRRDLQGEAKKAGRPWEMGKGFDGSAVIGPMTEFDPSTLPQSGPIQLDVNGAPRQSGDLSDMIWGVAETISALSAFLTLRAGDIIYTGTPEGVGAVDVGDHLTATCPTLQTLNVGIVASPPQICPETETGRIT